MTLSKLRPPNFLLSSATATNDDNNNNNRLSLASYTNKCQQQLLVAVSKSIDDGDNDGETMSGDDVINIDHAESNTNNNDNNRQGSNEPSMGQCILLLESHLRGFQKSCRQKEDKLHQQSSDGEGKKKRKKAHHTTQLQPTVNRDGGIEEDDDEVPPQLLRLARFFHYRWVPIKRALLRPVVHATHSNGDQQPTSNNNNDLEINEQHSTSSVEVGLKYRLRLAKACREHGLVAAAEYEMLIASLNQPSYDDNDDANGGMKRKSQNDDGGGGGGEDNLIERVRLALLRLPTDATTASISSSHATAAAAWRHVKEMILECCRYWEKLGVTTLMLLQTGNASLEGEDDAESYNELLSKLGIPKVVDWALTSWTALLLSQDVDCFTATTTAAATSSSTLTISNNNDPISKIEKEFATMLSNRSHTNSNNDPNLFLLFAMAASNRMNEILSYSHLKQMSGVHLLSMARLLATFHSRGNAEEHIMTSIITCSTVNGGGMDCLGPLSRLLAIYCCNISIVDGVAAPEDSLVGNTASRTTAADLESRLCGMLNDEAFVERVLSSLSKALQRGMMLLTAKSFTDVIFSTTAHFIKYGGRN